MDGYVLKSGALSTGEAIGTGMSILLMVVQSWEEESRRIRGKDIVPCRFTILGMKLRVWMVNLFPPCSNFANVLDMQLLIAAPENISPEKGQPINWCVKSPATKNKFMWLVCVALAQQSSFLKRSKQLAAFFIVIFMRI